MQRILVLRGGALGDLLVTLPALQALRNKWPKARIELVGNAVAGALAVDAGIIDEVTSQHTGSWHRMYLKDWPEEIRAMLCNYDLVINMWPDADGEISRHFPLIANQTFLAVESRPTKGQAAVHFLNALRPLNIVPGANLTKLRTSRPPSDVIAIHPGSGSPHKNWPQENWRELTQWLKREFHYKLHIIQGEAEPHDVLVGCGDSWANLPLSELADRLATCRLFLGHDSGISHLAACCCASGILLFGPSDPMIWAPPVPEFQIIKRGQSLEDIRISEVKSAIGAALG